MGDLEPITRNEKLWSGEDLEPVTRKEMYIKHLYDETQVIPEYPVTREEMFILKAGEELHDVTVEQLSVTENGIYSEEGVAYSPVIVNVPAPVLDELTVTENGTYTPPSGTDGYDEVTVDVPLPENAYLLKEIEDVEIASFNDGSDLPMPKLEVAIEPQQDLHGYDAPWVGGAGKNKQMTPIAENVVYRNGGNLFTLAFNNGVITFTITSDASTFFDIKAFEIKSEHVGKTYTMSYISSPSLDDNNCIFETWDGTTRVSLESKTVTITNDLVGKWLCCRYYKYGAGTYTISKCQVEEGSTATSYAPYSNICPILGWDKVNVGVSGINVWDEEWRNGYYNNGVFVYAADGVCCKNKIPIKPNTTLYYVKNFDITTNFYYTFYDKNGDFLRVSGYDGSGRIAKSSSGAISVPSGAYFMTFNMGSGYGATYKNDISINYPSTDTSYHAYNGSTITLDLDGTRYGGKVDLVSGVMTLTDGFIASYNGEVLPSTWISDRDVYAEGTTPTTGAEVCYKLATPLTIQLTPTVVKSLRGMNNVYADSGNILDLSYLAKEE